MPAGESIQHAHDEQRSHQSARACVRKDECLHQSAVAVSGAASRWRQHSHTWHRIPTREGGRKDSRKRKRQSPPLAAVEAMGVRLLLLFLLHLLAGHAGSRRADHHRCVCFALHVLPGRAAPTFCPKENTDEREKGPFVHPARIWVQWTTAAYACREDLSFLPISLSSWRAYTQVGKFPHARAIVAMISVPVARSDLLSFSAPGRIPIRCSSAVKLQPASHPGWILFLHFAVGGRVGVADGRQRATDQNKPRCQISLSLSLGDRV